MKSEHPGQAEQLALARTIAEYWRRRGHTVDVWVENQIDVETEDDTGYGWVVRSDMMNGYPPRLAKRVLE